MTPSISSSLLDEALSLPAEARAQLADILIDSLEPPLEPGLVKAIAAVVERRLGMLERGETTTISQEEYLASRRAKWSR
jgi:hypothetical protein